MNLLRAAFTVSGMTLLSRITGLIRENLTASLFGAGALTDAFFVAFRIPNLLRRMFAEGAFSQAFVPIFAASLPAANPAGAPAAATQRLVDQVATALAWILALVSIAGVLAAPILVYAMASGLTQNAQAFDAAVVMTRLMFPYIWLISLVALAAGILNTFKQFAVPAATPVVLNLAFIAAAWWLAPHVDPPIYALAIGVMVGGVAQLAIQLPALARLGLLPRLRLNLRAALAEPEVRRMIALMAPAALSVSVAQISLIINTHIASRLAPGSVSWVSFGDRLMEFPTALLGVALSVVLLPSLSRARAEHRPDLYSDLLDWGLRLAVMLALPCTVALALAATPMTALLFHYGRFTAHDVAMTQLTVQAYAVGLLGLIAVKILAPGYYAQQDVRTPVRIALFSLALTQLMNLAFVPSLKHAGLALSISLAALANASLLGIGLLKRGSYRPRAGWFKLCVRVALACVIMGVALGYAVAHFDWLALQANPLARAGWALLILALAGVLYLGVLFALGARPRDFVRRDR